MDNQVVVDASVWVSQFITKDTNYEASKTWITQFVENGGILIEPTFLLLEIAASIARRQGIDIESKQVVIDMKKNKIIRFIPLNSLLLQETIDVVTDLQLRAGDAIYTTVAYQRSIPLISWDKEQLQKASKIVQTYTPTTYPF